MMNRQRTRELIAALEAHLEDFAEAEGVKVTIEGGTYQGGSFMPKLIVAETDDDGVAMTPNMMALKRVKPDLVGKTFICHHGQIEFTGYNTRAPRYPLEFKVLRTGKRYKAGMDFVNQVTEFKAAA